MGHSKQGTGDARSGRRCTSHNPHYEAVLGLLGNCRTSD
ncbi:MAG: CRISPR-associated protein Cas5 [Actinomycetales bacterium]|nr:CRISPR-associated protein Cas5 [Actinomycetales bacterium]